MMKSHKFLVFHKICFTIFRFKSALNFYWNTMEMADVQPLSSPFCLCMKNFRGNHTLTNALKKERNKKKTFQSYVLIIFKCRKLQKVEKTVTVWKLKGLWKRNPSRFWAVCIVSVSTSKLCSGNLQWTL